MNKKLLTIAIPTYNRSKYLDLYLAQITKQITDFTDIVKKYIENEHNINYIVKAVNIGGDANIAKCYSLATIKYVWIFGDDDVLIDGALSKIMNYIQKDEYEVIYIKPYPYIDNYLSSMPQSSKIIYKTYIKINFEEMFYKVSDMFSFIFGNIINKSLVDDHIDPYKFTYTSYGQLNWVFLHFLMLRNLYIKDNLLSINDEGNSGGYACCKVFGTNKNIYIYVNH